MYNKFMSKNVFLDYIDNYNIKNVQASLEKALFNLGLTEMFKPKTTVLIKACLPYAVSPDLAETTHPSVVRAMVNILTEKGVKCIVADSPYKKYTLSNLEQVYLNTGMLEVANLTPCELNKNLKICKIETPKGVMAKNLTLLDVVNEVDAIINIGKVKIDEKLGYIGACANMFGLVPGEKKTQILTRLNTIEDFNNYNLDIMQTVKDKLVLNILDGVVAMEANKTPRMLYCLGVSENPYSIDASILDILGIDYQNSILQQSGQRELCNLDKIYKQIGVELNKFKVEDFALIELHNSNAIHKNEKERKKNFKNLQARPVIEEKRCKGCSICSKICPTNAISMRYDKNGELYAEIDYKKCIYCYKCCIACPYSVAEKYHPTGYKAIEKEIKKYNEE